MTAERISQWSAAKPASQPVAPTATPNRNDQLSRNCGASWKRRPQRVKLFPLSLNSTPHSTISCHYVVLHPPLQRDSTHQGHPGEQRVAHMTPAGLLHREGGGCGTAVTVQPFKSSIEKGIKTSSQPWQPNSVY